MSAQNAVSANTGYAANVGIALCSENYPVQTDSTGRIIASFMDCNICECFMKCVPCCHIPSQYVKIYNYFARHRIDIIKILVEESIVFRDYEEDKSLPGESKEIKQYYLDIKSPTDSEILDALKESYFKSIEDIVFVLRCESSEDAINGLRVSDKEPEFDQRYFIFEPQIANSYIKEIVELYENDEEWCKKCKRYVCKCDVGVRTKKPEKFRSDICFDCSFLSNKRKEKKLLVFLKETMEDPPCDHLKIDKKYVVRFFENLLSVPLDWTDMYYRSMYNIQSIKNMLNLLHQHLGEFCESQPDGKIITIKPGVGRPSYQTEAKFLTLITDVDKQRLSDLANDGLDIVQAMKEGFFRYKKRNCGNFIGRFRKEIVQCFKETDPKTGIHKIDIEPDGLYDKIAHRRSCHKQCTTLFIFLIAFALVAFAIAFALRAI